MRWSGAFRLLEGETHEFAYPAIFRSVTKEGITTYSLSQGSHYVFRVTGVSGRPELFRARDDRVSVLDR